MTFKTSVTSTQSWHCTCFSAHLLSGAKEPKKLKKKKEKKENDACVLLGNFFFTSNNHNFLFFFWYYFKYFHSLGTCFCKEVDVCTHVRTRISVSAHVLWIIECTSLVLLDHRSLPLHHCSLSTHSLSNCRFISFALHLAQSDGVCFDWHPF